MKNLGEKYCYGCHNNFYNSAAEKCWLSKSAKVEWRIPIGILECPLQEQRKSEGRQLLVWRARQYYLYET